MSREKKACIIVAFPSSILLLFIIIISCEHGFTRAATAGATAGDSQTWTDFPLTNDTMNASQSVPSVTTSRFVDHTMSNMSTVHSQGMAGWTSNLSTVSTTFQSQVKDGSTISSSTVVTSSEVMQPSNKSHVTSSPSQTTNPDGPSASEDIPEDNLTLSSVYEDGNGTLLSGWHWYEMEWPWYLIIPAISGVVGIIGNLLVILVLYQRRSANRSTDTLIGGLAVADFLTSIFIIPIPQDRRIPANWLGNLYCKIIHSSFFLWVSVIASTYILMAISIERFIAISYPIYFNRVLTKRRIQMVIVFIWFLSAVCCMFAFFVELVDPVTNVCIFRLPSAESLIIGYYWFFLRMVIPMLTMLITQTLIARELHRQSIRFKGDKESSTTKTVHLTARNRVLKMMFEVIIIYIVCWAPNQVAYMGYVLGFVPPSYLGSPLHHTLTVLGFCNSCANPFIYTARHPQFRAALKGMFTGVRGGTTPLFEQKMDSRTYGVTEQSTEGKEI